MTRKHTNKVADNGPPPPEAAAIYSGSVMHQRMKPKAHRFKYSVFSVLLDLDRLEEASASSWLFSLNSFNLLSFHERDHGKRDGTDLRQHIETLLVQKGLDAPARILLLAYPRLLGYGFNPLSVFYAFNAENLLIAIIYEVRNTFGDLHTYVAPVHSGQLSDAGVRQDQRKEFYVSPFVSMEQHYFFRMLPPGQTVKVRILEKDREGPLLSATFSGHKKPVTDLSILRECVRVPLLSFKVIAAIYWEAFKIWRKRVPFHSRPVKDAPIGEPDRKNRQTALAPSK